MFPVEIRLNDETDFVKSLGEIWKWVDLRQIAPLTLRYTFRSGGILFHADFRNAAAAAAFATEFGGRILEPIGIARSAAWRRFSS